MVAKLSLGRCSRSKYLWGVFLWFAIDGLAAVLGYSLHDWDIFTSGKLASTVVFGPFAIMRLHDFNRSGWYALVILAPFLDVLFFFFPAVLGGLMSLVPLLKVSNIFFVFLLAVLPGTPGPNDFGLNPLKPI